MQPLLGACKAVRKHTPTCRAEQYAHYCAKGAEAGECRLARRPHTHEVAWHAVGALQTMAATHGPFCPYPSHHT